MKALPREARRRNETHHESCHWCGNTGYIVAAKRVQPNKPDTYFEEMGPCPYCQKGYTMEFQKGAVWGPEGYWQGRDLDMELEPFEKPEPPLPPSEQRRKINELSETIGKEVA